MRRQAQCVAADTTDVKRGAAGSEGQQDALLSEEATGDADLAEQIAPLREPLVNRGLVDQQWCPLTAAAGGGPAQTRELTSGTTARALQDEDERLIVLEAGVQWEDVCVVQLAAGEGGAMSLRGGANRRPHAVEATSNAAPS